MTKIQITPAWKDVKPSNTYIYIHCRMSDGSPFYVGIGSYKRAWEIHASKRSEWWRRVGAKHGVVVVIAQDGLSRDDANLLEMWLIAKLRHEGYELCNITDGGDGCAGVVTGDDTKAKIGIANGKPIINSDGMTFNSSEDAARYLRENGHPKANHSTISVAASGVTNSAYGRAWWRSGDNPKEYIPRYIRTSLALGKQVMRSDGAMFRSTGHAAQQCRDEGWPNASQVNIGVVARGRRKIAYGYGWEYV